MSLDQTAPDGRPRRRPTLSAGNFRNSAGEKLISAAEQAGSADYYRSAGAGRSSRGRCADRPTLPGTGPGNRRQSGRRTARCPGGNRRAAGHAALPVARRISKRLGFETVKDLCSTIAAATGETVKVIDLVLWRYSADNRWSVSGPKTAYTCPRTMRLSCGAFGKD